MDSLITAPNISIAVFFIGLIDMIAGFLVYERDSSKQSNLFFLLLSVSSGLHAIVLAATAAAPIDSMATALAPLTFLAGASLILSLLLFSLALFPDRLNLTKKQLVIVIVPYVLAICTLAIPGFIVQSVSQLNGLGRSITTSPIGNGIFGTFLIVYVGAAVAILFRRYRQAAGVFRKQAQYIFLSVLISALVAPMTDFFLQSFGVGGLYWVGPLFLMVVMLLVGYFIVKYNFWNVKLVITELFVSLIYMVLILELAFSHTWVDFAVKSTILLLISVASVMLIQSVKNETESKEQVEHLLRDLEDVNEELRFLDKRKSGFVTVAAHHLREPLTAIAGYGDMLLEGSFGPITDRAREALTKIFDASKRLVVIIDDFMDISKIETGTMTYDMTAFDFRKLVEQVVGELSLNAEKAGLVLSKDVPESGDYTVIADYGKILQVVSNLVDNSIKYTPAGEVRVSLSKDDAAETVTLKITDTGIGMDEETQKKIFRKFSRAEGVSKVYTEGSGLGLYVAKEIVEQHGGKIWAESRGVGKGSSFFVQLRRDGKKIKMYQQ